MGRRFAAHIYDVLIFIVFQLIIFKLVEFFVNSQKLPNVLIYVISIILFIVFNFIVLGVFSYEKSATAGQVIEKLRVNSTKGKLTSFRFFIKNMFSLWIYYPFLAFIIITINQSGAAETKSFTEHFTNTSILLLLTTVVLVLFNSILNMYLNFKFEQSLTDRMFDMKVTLKKKNEISFDDFKKISKNKYN